MKIFVAILSALSLYVGSFLPSSAKADAVGTLSNVFWVQHEDAWPNPYTADSEICGLSFVDIMNTPSDGIAWYVLAHEWIPATLNVANGAPSGCIKNALVAAQDLLDTCDPSTNPDDIEDYLMLAGMLADYNKGILTGCAGAPDNAILIKAADDVCPPCCCPPCPATTCGDCNCPQVEECNCICDPHLVCVSSHGNHKHGSSSSSSSSSSHHHHHHKHHHHHHTHKSTHAAAKKPSVHKKKAQGKKKAQHKRANNPKKG